MSKILKNLKSIFITDELNGEKKKAPKAPDQPEAQSAETAVPKRQMALDDFAEKPADGKVSQKFIDVLFAAIEKNNQPNFDYLEYKQSLKHLAEIQMEEAVRFQSAYAAAKPQGVSKDKLLSSAQHYLDVLTAEEQKFKGVLDNQKKKFIDEGQNELQRLESSIAEKQQQIEALKAEIETQTVKLAEAEEKLKQSAQKVMGTKSQFEASLLFLQNQIKTDIDKINQYIS